MQFLHCTEFSLYVLYQIKNEDHHAAAAYCTYIAEKTSVLQEDKYGLKL